MYIQTEDSDYESYRDDAYTQVSLATSDTANTMDFVFRVYFGRAYINYVKLDNVSVSIAAFYIYDNSGLLGHVFSNILLEKGDDYCFYSEDGGSIFDFTFADDFYSHGYTFLTPSGKTFSEGSPISISEVSAGRGM